MIKQALDDAANLSGKTYHEEKRKMFLWNKAFEKLPAN